MFDVVYRTLLATAHEGTTANILEPPDEGAAASKPVFHTLS
jgi:hypothetical protein